MVPLADGNDTDEPEAVEGVKSTYDVHLARKPGKYYL